MNTANPYLDPAREWNERYGSFIKDRDNWKLTAFVAMGISLVAISGLIYVACLPKLAPYIVRTDGGGNVQSVQLLSKGGGDDLVVRAELSEWMTAHRTVSFDTSIQEKNIRKVYSFLDQGLAATSSVSDWYKENDPYQRMKLGTINVHVIAVIPQSTKTFQVDFTETSLDLNGKELPPSRTYRAVLSVEHKAVTDATYLVNPTGTYLSNISFQQIGG